MTLSRRGLLFGGAALLAAPAIVRVSSLMPVKPFGRRWHKLAFPYDGFTHYAGYDTLHVESADVLTAAEYEWRQAPVELFINGKPWRQATAADFAA